MKGTASILRLAERDMEALMHNEYQRIRKGKNERADDPLIKKAEVAARKAVQQVFKGSRFALKEGNLLDIYRIEDTDMVKAEKVQEKRCAELRLAFGQLERDMILASSSNDARSMFEAFLKLLK